MLEILSTKFKPGSIIIGCSTGCVCCTSCVTCGSTFTLVSSFYFLAFLQINLKKYPFNLFNQTLIQKFKYILLIQIK